MNKPFTEPRCRVCTCNFRSLYERLRFKENWKLKDIHNLAIEKFNETFSLMSLSRHLRFHCKNAEQPKTIEIPDEALFTENQALNFILPLFVKLDFPVSYIEDLKHYWKDYEQPLFLTKTSIYKMLHDMFKNVVPTCLSKFENIFEHEWNSRITTK